MSHFTWKNQSSSCVFTSILLIAGLAGAEPLEVATDEPLSPEARDAILNDSRTTPSADAASGAMDRGSIETPELEVDSPSAARLADKAADAAACRLAQVQFESGSTRLENTAVKQLSAVAACLKAQPNAKMWIIGQTDEHGPEATNWVVGMQRALAVEERLRALGVEQKQLVAVSAGETGERSVTLELSEPAPRDRVASR